MAHWSQILSDPNAPAVRAQRVSLLRKARAPVISDRIAHLRDIARGKSVLDIGVVEHNSQAFDNPYWLHRHLSEVAGRIVGIDILEPECRRLREHGYDIRCIDLTQTSLEEKFDLIVMGELIEHLDAPGPFLRNVAKMLQPAGLLVITTPNPWYINPVVKSFARAPFTDSADHVAWYDPSTILELGTRCGLTLTAYRPADHTKTPSWKARALFAFLGAVSKLGANNALMSKTIIYEFEKSK